MTILEGPDIQLLGNKALRYHTIEGNMGPNSLMVVYVDPLGISQYEHHTCHREATKLYSHALPIGLKAAPV